MADRDDAPGAHNRVLVVDDEPEIGEMLHDVLREAGYEVTVTIAAEDAIAAMATWHPAVVLLDLRMPGLPGLEALHYFRQHHRRVPVIVMTAVTEAQATEDARAAGAFEVLSKPFDVSLVKGVVAQAMRYTRA